MSDTRSLHNFLKYYFWLKLFSATVAAPSDFLQKTPMQQSPLLAFAVVGKQAEETREQRQARQHAREERKKEALALLGLPWQEPTRKGAGRPTFKDQYRAAKQSSLMLLTSTSSQKKCLQDGGLDDPWCKRRRWQISSRRHNRLLLLHRSRISRRQRSRVSRRQMSRPSC